MGSRRFLTTQHVLRLPQTLQKCVGGEDPAARRHRDSSRRLNGACPTAYPSVMNVLTVVLSLLSALIVAFLSPKFGYFVWRKQRRREQQLALADRFAKLNSDLRIIGNLKPRPKEGESSSERHAVDAAAPFLEQNALLSLIFVAFERKHTLESALMLKRAVDAGTAFQSIYSLRVDLLARLFAEALEIPPDVISRRSEMCDAEHILS